MACNGAKSRGASGGRSGRGGEQGRGIRHAYLSSSLRLAEMACEREHRRRRRSGSGEIRPNCDSIMPNECGMPPRDAPYEIIKKFVPIDP